MLREEENAKRNLISKLAEDFLGKVRLSAFPNFQ